MPHCRPMPTSRGSGMISPRSRLMALFSTSPTCLSAYPCQSPDASTPAIWSLLLQLIYKMQTSPSHDRGVSVCPARAAMGGPALPSGKNQVIA